MKKLWARLGVIFEVNDEDYKLIDKAMKNKDNIKVREILSNSKNYVGGDSYFPSDCEDNPNEEEYDF
ncbi:hypothetical protein SAMN05443270_3066 [Lacrimispora sphenoides]|jgi:hypothetical protein|uniref:hypothetical protein n=1 Tax=Lacrimispora sphenoides TaxID=29370 RepID=UPI0008B7D976|nr:hypothetical protein [Lacrimispora sphenoides]SEU09153.1 hypothetical protein SAMN05443270_3066 [Lacrimispora sphenoides]